MDAGGEYARIQRVAILANIGYACGLNCLEIRVLFSKQGIVRIAGQIENSVAKRTIFQEVGFDYKEGNEFSDQIKHHGMRKMVEKREPLSIVTIASLRQLEEPQIDKNRLESPSTTIVRGRSTQPKGNELLQSINFLGVQLEETYSRPAKARDRDTKAGARDAKNAEYKHEFLVTSKIYNLKMKEIEYKGVVGPFVSLMTCHLH
ncbi:uncharacterized protein G2W53_001065 [Senna tora]|uniref:Uncharacterized protein n=1 Tax=Senna tora TaxID=362788 RepID=A0A834XGS8_9FABA|nr:uncharacterized protein G2W53_001065 [Senna tora]